MSSSYQQVEQVIETKQGNILSIYKLVKDRQIKDVKHAVNRRGHDPMIDNRAEFRA